MTTKLIGSARVNGVAPAHAHPVFDSESHAWAYTESGLTKREMIAAMALQGICSNPQWYGGREALARDAVTHADALLAELAK